MIDSKFKSFYLDYFVSKLQKYDRNINIFLALSSSGGISGWAVWQEYETIWVIIIAGSTIINVIKPYLPFSKYIKELNNISLKMQNLHLDYERLWYKFEKDPLDEDSATEQFFVLKKRGSDYLRLNEDTYVFEDNKVYKKAEEKMELYLKSDYNVQC